MKYKNITTQIIDLINKANPILSNITGFSTSMLNDVSWSKKCEINNEFYDWFIKAKLVLEKNDLKLQALKIENIYNNTTLTPKEDKYFRMIEEEMKIRSILDELIRFAEKLERSDKEIEIIKIEDIDAFKDLIKTVDTNSLMGKYDNSVFLEDDVENVFINGFYFTLCNHSKVCIIFFIKM